MSSPLRALGHPPRRGRRAAVLPVLLLAACGGPAAHAVDIRAFGYQPDTVVVAVGDTVVWANADLVPHTATGTGWDTGPIGTEAEGRWVAPRAGTHPYVCAYHPTMQGVVVVE